MPTITAQLESPWPHRLAVLLVCATFPLIWVGGLVTTYEAGMAVPDWPTTFGYNMFLYPWQTWVLGPWDLFIEHGHRLLGATVGMLTIAMMACVFRFDHRRWMRAASVAALALVILQGVLGGLRVRFDERLLAQIHGCVGPAFFALTVAMAVWTSRRWLAGPTSESQNPLAVASPAGAAKFQRLAGITTVLCYVQLVLGSQLRHIRPGVEATTFRAAVWLHLFMAAMVALHVALLAVRAVRTCRGPWNITRPAVALASLVALQLSLGAGAWVVNYGFPTWFSGYSWAQTFVVTHESQTQAAITTAHVATGSLILVTALLVTLRSLLLPTGTIRSVPRLGGLGVAL